MEQAGGLRVSQREARVRRNMTSAELHYEEKWGRPMPKDNCAVASLVELKDLVQRIGRLRSASAVAELDRYLADGRGPIPGWAEHRMARLLDRYRDALDDIEGLEVQLRTEILEPLS